MSCTLRLKESNHVLKESNDVVHTQPVAQGPCTSALLLLPRRWPQRHHALDELHAPWNLRTTHTPRAQAAVIVSLFVSHTSRQHTRPGRKHARTHARKDGLAAHKHAALHT